MSEATIPVDLFNPGQVFACLGFLEAADILLGDALGGFDWAERRGERFVLRARGADDPFAAVLEFLSKAEVKSLSPQNSTNDTWRWDVPTIRVPLDDPFPVPDPDSPAKLPVLLVEGERRLVLDHWGDDGTCRDSVKLWGGAAGYPAAARAKDALDLVRDACVEAAKGPFTLARPQSSSFNLDWRRDYIPIDAGFSLNTHSGRIASVGYPLVELLAAVGLTHARPRRHTALDYTYAVLQGLHEPALVRAVLGDPADKVPFTQRRFRMRLGYPGKEGQFRSITSTTEETQH